MAASRLPQSRRLRPPKSQSSKPNSQPPQDCRSRGDCGDCDYNLGILAFPPPQDCRSRGDCGDRQCKTVEGNPARLKIAAVAATAATPSGSPLAAGFTASRLPQSRRLRRLNLASILTWTKPPQDCRSRGDCGIPPVHVEPHSFGPPQDCRSRGDCGCPHGLSPFMAFIRLKIAAVAATAADNENQQSPRSKPPQDCRSRGDCG